MLIHRSLYHAYSLMSYYIIYRYSVIRVMCLGAAFSGPVAAGPCTQDMYYRPAV